jgi:hypothetical protein
MTDNITPSNVSRKQNQDDDAFHDDAIKRGLMFTKSEIIRLEKEREELTQQVFHLKELAQAQQDKIKTLLKNQHRAAELLRQQRTEVWLSEDQWNMQADQWLKDAGVEK